MCPNTRKYLEKYVYNLESEEILAGETELLKHSRWVHSLPIEISNDPQATAKWITNSLALLAGTITEVGDSFEELSSSLKRSICKLRGEKLSSDLIVKIEEWRQDKLCGSWPVEKIIIKDPVTKKCITIGAGGDRKHCEIMNIQEYTCQKS